MKNKFNKIIVLLVFFSLLFISQRVLYAQLFSPFAIDELIGQQAPSFTAFDLSGKKAPFSSLKGKPILLNFWATWCPYCREERQQLNAIHRKYKQQGLEIVAVSIDRSRETVLRYLKKMPADFTVLHDSNKEAAKLYGIYSLPTSFLIDREGVIKHKFIGANWTENKKKLIEELIP
jgi:DsbE subfamily thiol:disulfide oxidoreductase